MCKEISSTAAVEMSKGWILNYSYLLIHKKEFDSKQWLICSRWSFTTFNHYMKFHRQRVAWLREIHFIERFLKCIYKICFSKKEAENCYTTCILQHHAWLSNSLYTITFGVELSNINFPSLQLATILRYSRVKVLLSFSSITFCIPLLTRVVNTG